MIADGGDERPARVAAGYLTVEEAEQIARELAIEKLVERAETAERALVAYRRELFDWLESDTTPRIVTAVREKLSEHEQIIPPLLERYGEG